MVRKSVLQVKTFIFGLLDFGFSTHGVEVLIHLFKAKSYWLSVHLPVGYLFAKGPRSHGGPKSGGSRRVLMAKVWARPMGEAYHIQLFHAIW